MTKPNKNKERKFLGKWIPASIWLRKDISPKEKIFLAEINSLDADERRCFRSNEDFGVFFRITPKSAGRVIDGLVKKGLVFREIDPSKTNKQRRKLWGADGVMEPTGATPKMGRLATPEMMKQPPQKWGGSHPINGEALYIDENTRESTEREKGKPLSLSFEEILKKIPTTKSGKALREHIIDNPYLSLEFTRWLVVQAVSRFEKKIDLSETELGDWQEQFEEFGEELFIKAIKSIRIDNKTKGNLPSIGEVVAVAKMIRANINKKKIVREPEEPPLPLTEKIRKMTRKELVAKIEKVKGFPKGFRVFLKDYQKELKSREETSAQTGL